MRRFVGRCLAARGAPNAHAVIYHGGPGHPDWGGRARGATHVVVPIRHPGYRRQSMYRRQLDWARYPPAACHASIFRMALDHDLPLYLLSYEALVADPEGVGRDLAEFLELPFVPWPAEVDGTNPTEGAVFDANAKYRETASP